MTLEELARGATEKAAELQAENAAFKEENERLKARVAELEAKDPNLISTCGCRFENDTGNTVLLCEACSELPCHNPNAETKEPANES